MKLPQLSLRELFLLVALVAMGCGWWVDRWQQQQTISPMNIEMDRLRYELKVHQMHLKTIHNQELAFDRDLLWKAVPPKYPAIKVKAIQSQP